MNLEQAGPLQRYEIRSEQEHIGYLLDSANKGVEILPLLKARMGSALRTEVQSVRFQYPMLIVLIESVLEPVQVAGFDGTGFRPLEIRELPLYSAAADFSEDSLALLDLAAFCQQTHVAVELGLAWPAELEVEQLRSEVQNLEEQLECSERVIRLLTRVAEEAASDRCEQLQEQIINQATGDMLNRSAAADLVADSENGIADLFGSVWVGVLQSDIRDAVEKRMKKLSETDQLILALGESGALQEWLENQSTDFQIAEYPWEIQLPLDELVDRIAREVASRVSSAE